MWVGALLQSRRITGILGDELAITGETILVGIVDREITGRVIASTLIAFLGGKLDRLLTIDRLNAKRSYDIWSSKWNAPQALSTADCPRITSYGIPYFLPISNAA